MTALVSVTAQEMEIKAVDGLLVDNEHAIKVTPGVHAFRLRHKPTPFWHLTDIGVIAFGVEAGHSYQVDARLLPNSGLLVMWVTDRTTGETVVGRQPPTGPEQ